MGADPTRLTDEEAGEIVEWQFDTYRDYEDPSDISCYIFMEATASLDSLAASLGISKPYVILKNK